MKTLYINASDLTANLKDITKKLDSQEYEFIVTHFGRPFGRLQPFVLGERYMPPSAK